MSKSSFAYVIYIHGRPEEVWKALVDPDLTRRYWFHENISDWQRGSEWKHRRTDSDAGKVDIVGRVLEVDPPHRLVLSWTSPEDPEEPSRSSRVSFEISPQDDWPFGPWAGLRVFHSDLEPDSEMLHSITFGWPAVLSGLKSILDNLKSSLRADSSLPVMLSLLPSTLVLGLAALTALHLANSRSSPPERASERMSAARALTLAVGVQSAHFAEEAATGFHERFGAVFALPGMPLTLFLVFNLTWLGIWVASIPGLRSARTGAFFAAWFLAIAGTVNSLAHPLLALATRGYFPGLVSSPFIGAAGVWLWLRPRDATRPDQPGLRAGGTLLPRQ